MPRKKADDLDVAALEINNPTPMTEEELQAEERETEFETAETINEYFAGAASDNPETDPPAEAATEEAAEEDSVKSGADELVEKAPAEEAPKPRASRKRSTKMEQAAEKATSRREVIEDARRREKQREAAAADKEGAITGYIQLRAAMSGRVILTGKIASSEQYRVTVDQDTGAKATEYVLCVILDQKYKVHIHLNDMFVTSPFDMSLVDLTTPEGREEYSRRQGRLAESFVGAEVPFKIVSIDGTPNSKASELVIRGSRKAALADLVRINYENNQRINEGDILEVPIHAVGNHAVRVNVGGVDTTVSVARLSFEFMPLVKAMYSVGDKLRVKVLKINRDRDGHVTGVTVGATDAILEDAKERSYLVSEGATVHGVISNMVITKGDRARAVGALESSGLPMLVNEFSMLSFGDPPKVGDTVKLRVKGVAPSGFVICTYRGKVGAVNYPNHFIM